MRFLNILLIAVIGLGVFIYDVDKSGKNIVLSFIIINYVLISFIFKRLLTINLLSPLLLLLGIAFLRYGISGIPVLLGMNPPYTTLFQFVKIDTQDWLNGLLLVFTGLYSVIVGWKVVIDKAPKQLFKYKPEQWSTHYRVPVIVKSILLIAMTIGLISLFVYTGKNVNWAIFEVILEGGIRKRVITEGTGVYFHLAHLAIVASVIISTLMYCEGKSIIRSLFPSIITFGVFFTLGGRIRAVTPIFASILAIYHLEGGRGFRFLKMVSAKKIILGFLFLFVILTLFLAGVEYREEGINALNPRNLLVKIKDYISLIVWEDIGNLYAIALVTQHEPGILRGMSFIGVLGPIAEWFGLRGMSGGVFVISQYFSFGEKEWGTHTGLIGETFLNFGFLSIVLICFVFGLCLGWIEKKLLHSVYHRDPWKSSFFSILTVYFLRIFFEKVGRLFELWIVLSFFVGLYFLSKIATSMQKSFRI
ncbi:MAG: O-antigen polymerase [Candidatus Aenigmatarchaeota archaeon]